VGKNTVDEYNRQNRRATAAVGRPGSKNYERARPGTGVFGPKKKAIKKYAKTEGFDYKGGRTEEDPFKAGANILDKKGKVKERKGFSEYLKATGNRADDPRNWEFHYKAPSSRYSTRGKNDRQVDNVAVARRRAETTARREGKAVFEVQQIEYETQGIIRGTEEASAKAKARGGAGAFGSTSVAAGVAAQKSRGQRRSGRGGARRTTPGPFDAAKQTRSSRIA